MAIGNSGCTPAWDPSFGNAYGYKPSLAGGIVFCVLFGLSMLVHVGQSIYYRSWWSMVFAVGALTELLGWAARTWSSECPYNANAFLMQITTLIIAPTFFTAGVYVILGRIIQILGRKTSPISPAMYLWIFCTIDVMSLVIQAVGGGLAAVAFNSTPQTNTKPGTDTMVAGIDFQLASVIIFTAFFAYVIYRATVILHMPVFKTDKNMRTLVFSTGFVITLVVMRSIYRTIELAGGWEGYVIQTERFFLALDGASMAAAVITYNIIHPGMLLQRIGQSEDQHIDKLYDGEAAMQTDMPEK
ncbi:hypothetical protein AAFC00_003111 [Neodothiora populina]|uniref:RTA1-domain-containing protein n=1 Tax=Neodothiora populina TaxID=2781224 RepID=A0ABR3P9Q5_9PEZI